MAVFPEAQMSDAKKPGEGTLEELASFWARLASGDVGEPGGAPGAPAWERFLAAILETNGVLMSALDREHRFVFWNRGAERITGFSREEVLGGPGVLEVIYPDEEDRRRAAEAREAVMRGEPADGLPLVVRTKGGAEKTIAFYSRGVRGALGEPVGLVNVGIDVTESLGAERALRESEARFRSLFETMTEGVALHRLLLDERGEPADYLITDANSAYESHTGIRREDAVGRRASELYGASGAPYLDVFARVATTGEPTRMEVHFEPMRRHFRILVFSPARGEFATVFEDITAAKEMEAALKSTNEELVSRNEELDAYAHTVAHDLKNPVSAILGFAEHLEQGFAAMPEDERRESLEAITRSAQKMQGIIDALLLIGETRRSDVANVPFDMGPIAAESLRNLAHEVKRLGAEVRLPSAWPAASGYAPWVEQVLTNYVSNALKYGGRPPRVELGAAVVDGRCVRFWVRDNGRGLRADEIARTFTPFTRLARDDVDGHGLGLSIVRRLVERMGGEVAVESDGTPGSGCTFSFTLPRA
jgi:PAS domain S-box-containing protein